MQVSVVPAFPYGVEVWLVIVNGVIKHQFMSEAFAQAKAKGYKR